MASKPLSRLPPATRAGLSLGELAAELAPFGPVLHGDPALRVSDVVQDSRRVVPGALFVARAGSKTDGLRHVPEAAKRGAAGVLLSEGAAPVGSLGLPWISVQNLPRALAFAAEAVQGKPSRELLLVGVTGTNGKTTVTWLVQRALERLGGYCGRLGTLGFEVAGQQFETDLTTPEADTLSRGLAWMRTLGAGVAAMEVSSIALSSARADALRFEVAAFTNLTQDHLDFHGSFDAYRQAKARLFLELSPAVSVLNLDDEFGTWLRDHATSRVITVGSRGSCDVQGAELVPRPEGVAGRLCAFGRDFELRTRLVGRHNAENLLVAFGILAGLGVDLTRAAEALSEVSPVPGRLERCDGSEDDCVVLVDYAHTPDALERVLAALSPVRGGKLICVFGCGGDRDPTKRFPMGRAVGQGAGYAILTNDNPRGEAPEAIAAAVEAGLQATGAAYEIILDRERAIERAVAMAEPGDVVLLAGKGHEPYQLIGGKSLPFDDRAQARRALARRRSAREGNRG